MLAESKKQTTQSSEKREVCLCTDRVIIGFGPHWAAHIRIREWLKFPPGQVSPGRLTLGHPPYQTASLWGVTPTGQPILGTVRNKGSRHWYFSQEKIQCR